jgi:hypothetical protein
MKPCLIIISIQQKLKLFDMIDRLNRVFFFDYFAKWIDEKIAFVLVVFPVPQLCEFLTVEKKQKVFLTCDQDEQGSKVKDFFEKFPEIFEEMKWQRKLRHQPTLYWFSSHMSLWSDISFNFAVLINILVAFFYPFNKGLKGKLTDNRKVRFLCSFISKISIHAHQQPFGVHYLSL